jgi:L-2-hydroxycarboxylate dehydrogenase (NAD+)
MSDRLRVPDDIAVRVLPDDMRDATSGIFATLGMSAEDAAQSADVLIYADVRGIDSHGVSNMMPWYVQWLRDGWVNPAPVVKVVREAAGVATLDSDRGLGLAVGPHAMRMAMDKAEACGVGAVSVSNARHYGAAAYHAALALERDMIGVSMTVGGLQVVPTFGSKPMVGLNPIAVAAPTQREAPFVFDASMSSVAGNKIALAQRLGADVPGNWIARTDGSPILEEGPVPKEFFMLPLGGTREIGSHKGYGLAVVVDILSGLLSGSPPGFLRRPSDVSHHFTAYRIDAFTDLADFKRSMDEFMRGLRETPPAPGEERVLYAGLPEAETEADRSVRGIPYHPKVVDWFRRTCDELGVEHRLG